MCNDFISSEDILTVYRIKFSKTLYIRFTFYKNSNIVPRFLFEEEPPQKLDNSIIEERKYIVKGFKITSETE